MGEMGWGQGVSFFDLQVCFFSCFFNWLMHYYLFHKYLSANREHAWYEPLGLNGKERHRPCLLGFTVSWGLSKCCDGISAVGRYETSRLSRPSRVPSRLFTESRTIRVKPIHQKSLRPFLLVCKLAKQCHHLQSSRERQRCGNEGRLRRWIADLLALDGQEGACPLPRVFLAFYT